MASMADHVRVTVYVPDVDSEDYQITVYQDPDSQAGVEDPVP